MKQGSPENEAAVSSKMFAPINHTKYRSSSLTFVHTKACYWTPPSAIVSQVTASECNSDNIHYLILTSH